MPLNFNFKLKFLFKFLYTEKSKENKGETNLIVFVPEHEQQLIVVSRWADITG